MIEILKDIISHTHKLGFMNTVKITGDNESTKIDSIADDRSVVMMAQTADPQPNMQGVFGLAQMEKLKYLLDGNEYKEDATIEVVTEERNGTVLPVGIHFENKDGDFKNDYNFMNSSIVNEKVKSVKFLVPPWHVEVAPTVNAIQRFQFQAGANPEITHFLAKTEGDKLLFSFGDLGTDRGEFTFASNITGKLNKSWTWPVSNVLNILKIADGNNTTMSFSNDGALKITLDSGIATYQYIILAQA
jgi:hypothetical protein